jgi:hypothetical protein
MLNAQCSMLNVQCSMLNVQCSMLNAGDKEETAYSRRGRGERGAAFGRNQIADCGLRIADFRYRDLRRKTIAVNDFGRQPPKSLQKIQAIER